MSKYAILNNDKATIFVDVTSGLIVRSRTEPVKLEKGITPRMKEAIKGGAIKILSEEEAKDLQKKTAAKVVKEAKKSKEKEKKVEEEDSEDTDDLEAKLKGMSSEERLEYYKANYEVSPEEEEEFKKMKSKAQVKLLLED